MSYEKQTWIDDVTPATADRLNHIEDGIEQVYADVDESLEPYVSHDGTPQVGDLLAVKSVSPLVVERRGLPQDRSLVKGGTVHPMDDEFDDGVYSGWTEYHVMNPTVTTTTEAGGLLSIRHSGTTDTTTQATHGWYKSISNLSYPFVIEGAFRAFRRYAVNYQMWGLIMTDGLTTASKAMWMMPYASTATAAAWTLSTRYGTINSVNTDSGSQTWEMIGNAQFQRLTAVSANLWRAEYSPDGVSWIQWPVADFSYTMTPTHVGFAMANWASGGNQLVGSVEYFRVYQPPHERSRTDALGMTDSRSVSFVYSASEINPMFLFDSISVVVNDEEVVQTGVGLLDTVVVEVGYNSETLSNLGSLDDITSEVT